jgi:hypothetical protein
MRKQLGEENLPKISQKRTSLFTDMEKKRSNKKKKQ